MMTLLPALLVITGRWVFWPAKPGYGTAEPTAPGVLGAAWAPHRRGGRAVVWIGTV